MCFSRIKRLLGRDSPDTHLDQRDAVSVRATFAIFGEIPDVDLRLTQVLQLDIVDLVIGVATYQKATALR